MSSSPVAAADLPKRRAKKSSTAAMERLSQSVPDIEFDPNDNGDHHHRHHRPRRASSPRQQQRRDSASRGVRPRDPVGEVMAEVNPVMKTANDDPKKRSGRKNKPALPNESTSADHSFKTSYKTDASMSIASKDVSVKSSGDIKLLKRKKNKRSDNHDSQHQLNASKNNVLSATGRASLNTSRDLSPGRASMNVSSKELRRRQRSTSRSKTSRRSTSRPKTSRRSTSRPRTDPQQQQQQQQHNQHQHHGRSTTGARRDRSSSRDHNPRKTSSPLAERSRREKSSTAAATTSPLAATIAAQQQLQQPSRRSVASSSGTMASLNLPVKNLGSRLYDVDRPRQNSIHKRPAAHDEVSVQSNLLLTKEQRAWKGIDDILDKEDDDHGSVATRDVLPESVAKAMQREKQRMPELMNSSFSSIRSEMTNLTVNTAVTAAKNYVVQPPPIQASAAAAAADPMQAFLGSIAENLIAETHDAHNLPVDDSTSAAASISTSPTVTAMSTANVKLNDTLRSRSTESSGSMGIQEYYASTSSKLQHVGGDDDEQESSEDEEQQQRYDPTIQAYGRASMPPKRPNPSRSVDGMSTVDMPALMNSSFSSIQSELTDIQSIISTAKNFVVKDEVPAKDDPMSSFLGRMTNGLRARQMLVEEGVSRVDDSDSSNEEHDQPVVLDDVNAMKEVDDEEKEDGDMIYKNGHIPAEDELSGADQSIPDEGDLSGAELEADEDEDDYYEEENDGQSESDHLEDEELSEEGKEDDFNDPEQIVGVYLPPNTPGGLGSIPSLSSVSTMNTHQQSQVECPSDPLTQWAANLRHDLAQKMAGESAPLTPEEQESLDMEKILARAAEIAAEEKNETDITRVVLDEEVVQGLAQEIKRERAKAAGPVRKKKKMKKKVPAGMASSESAGATGPRPTTRPPPGRRKVLKKKTKPVQPLPAPAEDPELFSAMFKEEQRPQQVVRQKSLMPVAAVKAVAKAAIPIPKHSKKEKYEQKSTLKSLKEKLHKMTFLRGKSSSRRNSPTSVGGDEGKYFPRENREEDEEEDASFL